jgi:energy-coupling factor transporter ATP-binding protein EcfA2
VQTIPRQEFLDHYWDYQPGEHVTILGPTGSGKTHLAYQLLHATATPQLPARVLVMKPRDSTVVQWSKTAGFPRTHSWPPKSRRWWWEPRPRGHVVWPKPTYDPDVDDELIADAFHRTMRSAYRDGNTILFADEAFGIIEIDDPRARGYSLTRDLRTLWTRGRSMGAGIWAASQKPTHLPLWAYNSAAHLLLYKDPDKRARDRFAEIGGVDPDLVKHHNMILPKFHALYIRRDGPHMCIVGP